MKFSVWLCSLVIFKQIQGEYEIPTPKLVAFAPSGFRVKIRADPKVELFAFHGKVNKQFKQLEPGDFTEDIRVPVNGFFVYENPHLRVKVGDEINYWVFVQHDGLGYRMDNRKWKVKELKSKANCITSDTIVSNQDEDDGLCSNFVFFEEEFVDSSINSTKWIWEQYIPDAPDYEFVLYKKDPSVTSVSNNRLIIKPKLQSDSEIYKDVMDLTEGCTRTTESKRYRCKSRLYLVQNPIVSGRLTSQINFSYADIEIKAKLPSGDWIYPEIYLEDENYNRLLIAYSRGNTLLKGNNDLDIGGSLLFGGPMPSPSEPERSRKLSSYKNTAGPLSDDFHVYRLKWSADSIELFIDGYNYGFIDRVSLQSSGFASIPPNKCRLVIGIGVGGISDFPDDFNSGNYTKPWKNKKNTQVKSFYEARDEWLPSWKSGGELQVEYVRMKAV